MANVDQCVRYCELAMCEDMALYSDMITQIPDLNRVVALRGKNRQQIIDLLTNCRKTVQIDIVNLYYSDGINYTDITFTSDSTNNRDGADIIHTLPSGQAISIELKFGQKTDRAIGMVTFENIFGASHFTEALSVNTRKGWIQGYVNQPDVSQQKYRLETTLNRAIDGFNQYYDDRNRRLSESAQEYMERVIINNTGDGSKDSTHLLRYIVEGDQFREIKRIPTGHGYWMVKPVKPLGPGVSRVTIFVYNSTTNVQIKFLLNWKNNYKLPNGDKVSAKLGLGSPSWNVWIEVDASSV
ncbi:hypothetical protein B7Y94_03440 [Candidatus Saccharibacteria bacterium 32-49-12]|nr:MAG: hypothetical protein B7Y94_03440 [Candidatus Saccharibacteria bacterium 32-49-12]